MIRRLLILLFTAAVLLIVGFSTGGAVFLLLAALLLLVMAYSALSVFLFTKSLRVTASVDRDRLCRGDDAVLSIEVRSRSLLPVAPVELEMNEAGESRPLVMNDTSMRGQLLQYRLLAEHVGEMRPGISQAKVSDIFGLLTVTCRLKDAICPLLVLPKSFATQDLTYAPGDSGFETLARATEDISNPADVRGYQPGDALKKIHWKLSLRKGELMVRRFEEPVLGEALILPDCSPPPEWGHAQAAADIRDALLETALSVAAHESQLGHGVHLPLTGAHPWEFDGAMGIPALEENLARLDFSETDRFERVLMLETRRMRKVGATAVVAARLNSAMIDMMIRMRRMGPYVCFYLITLTPDDPRIGPLVSKLRQGDVEVRIIRPDEHE